jgi:hypothetical protein
MRYYITLHNKSEHLDLRNKTSSIEEVIKIFASDSKYIRRYDIKLIQKHFIELEVDEVSNHWHRFFGKKLANSSMVNFRSTKDSRKLFKWSKIMDKKEGK